MKWKIIREIKENGLEEVANRFIPIFGESLRYKQKQGESINGDFDRLRQLGRELTIIRNCMLGSIHGNRTPERVADNVMDKVKRYPEIEKHLRERL